MTFPFPIVDTTSISPPSVSYRASAGINSSLTTYNFTSHDIGTAGSNRFVVAYFQTRNGSTTGSSATIGGVSAAKIVEQQNSGHTNTMWGAAVPTGTSVTVTLVCSGAGNSSAYLHVWALYDLTSTSATVTTSSTASDPSLNMNMTEGDVMVIGGSTNAASASVTATGYTSRATATDAQSVSQHAGDHLATSDESPRTFTIDFSTTPALNIGMAAAWR